MLIKSGGRMSEEQAKYGWSSNFPNFSHTPARVIRGHLEEFVRDAGERHSKYVFEGRRWVPSFLFCPCLFPKIAD
jgi:hypothetical protein